MAAKKTVPEKGSSSPSSESSKESYNSPSPEIQKEKELELSVHNNYDVKTKDGGLGQIKILGRYDTYLAVEFSITILNKNFSYKLIQVYSCSRA